MRPSCYLLFQMWLCLYLNLEWLSSCVCNEALIVHIYFIESRQQILAQCMIKYDYADFKAVLEGETRDLCCFFSEDGGDSFSNESPRYEDGPRERGKERKRGTFPKHATNILKSWLFQHLSVSILTVHYFSLELAKEQAYRKEDLMKLYL